MYQNIGKEKSDSTVTVKSFQVNSPSDAQKSGESVSASPVSLKSDERSTAVMPENSPQSREIPIITTPQSGAQTTPIMGRIEPMVHTAPAIRMIDNMPTFGPQPVLAHCPNCNCECLTETKFEGGSTLCSSVLCVCVVTTFCCCCCLAFVPTLIEEFYDVVHSCRNCHSYLATYKRNCC